MQFWQNAINDKAQTEFQRNVERAANEVNRRFDVAAAGLTATQGLFAASYRVDRAEFEAFVQSLELPNKFPGVRGLGVIERVTRPKLDAFVLAEQNNRTTRFDIRQLTNKAFKDLYVVKFMAPAMFNEGVEGMDAGSEPLRRAAVELAVDTGELTLTVAPQLMQGQPNTPGVLMYLPVYDKTLRPGNATERRAALKGLVYTAIVIADFFKEMPSVVDKRLNFELFDNTPDRLNSTPMHDSRKRAIAMGSAKAVAVAAPRFTSRQTLVVGGRVLALQASSTPEFEATIDHSSKLWLLASGTLMSVMFALLLHLQMTGRRRAEVFAKKMTRQLRLQEARWRDFSSSASDWFWETDAQHRYCFFSDNFEQILGLQQGQLLGKTRTELMALDALNTPEIVNNHLAQLEAHLPFKNFEFQIRTNQGDHRWVCVSGLPHHDEDGRFIGYRGTGMLITLRKQAEQTLATGVLEREKVESIKNEWFRLQSAALEVCANAILIVDREGLIQWINPAFSALSGYSAAEAVGYNTRALFKSGAQNPDFYSDMWTTVCAGTPWKRELINQRKDGSLYQEEMTITPVKDEHGVVTHFIAVKLDITAHKRIEEIANASNRAKSEFLANMSHEIRTPMNGVIGMVDVLQQTRLEPLQQRMLDTIQTSSMALLGILNDILDFSKIEAGKLGMELLPTHLRALAEGVGQLMRPIARAKLIEISVFVSPALPHWIVSDPTRLRQILLNLMGNAVKFTSQQPGRPARVMLWVEPGPGAHGTSLQLRISDTGIGISPASQLKLFQPFTQADESTARQFGGTGLGLSISQRLVELLGGSVSVQSTLGEGSAFTVLLPLQAAPPERMPVFGPTLEGLQVLTLLEDPVLAGIVACYCGEAGATVLALADTPAAWQHLAHRPGNTDNSAVLLALEVDDELRERCRQNGVGLVLLETSTRKLATQMTTVNAYPLLYSDLIRALSLSSGRLTLSTTAPLSPAVTSTLRHVPLVGQANAGHQPLILLAEDNETNRDVIQAQLRLLGCTSEAAEDGVQALALWRSGRFALLLTDCHMPNMDGFELTAAIRKTESAGQRFPIVAITANAMQGEAERCRSLGMDDYLSKPLRMADLAPMLRKWLPVPLELELPLASASAPENSALVMAVWDATTLGSLVGDNLAIQHRLLTKYLLNAEKQVAALILAADAGEFIAATDLAHSLKSSSRTVGALRLGNLCEDIEYAGQAGHESECSALSSQLRMAFKHATKKINQHLACAEV